MTTRPPNLMPCANPIDLRDFEVPHPRPFVCNLSVDSQELSSTIEHVSNIEYVRWLDRAAELHADSLGFTRKRMLCDGIMWFVARHEINYRAEAWKGDSLIIATWVRDLRRVKSWRDYIIIRPADDQVVCTASTLWVLVDLATRRPKTVPPDMAMSFDALSSAGHVPYHRDASCTSR